MSEPAAALAARTDAQGVEAGPAATPTASPALIANRVEVAPGRRARSVSERRIEATWCPAAMSGTKSTRFATA